MFKDCLHSLFLNIISILDIEILDVSEHTVTISLCDAFAMYEEALSYSLFVLTTHTPKMEEFNSVLTWSSVQNKNPWPPYVAIHKCKKLFSLGDQCSIRYLRTKRDTNKRHTILVIGKYWFINFTTK